MKKVYVYLDNEGKINRIFGTLKRCHVYLIEENISIHRSYATFKKFFMQFGGKYEINGFKNIKGSIEKFDID